MKEDFKKSLLEIIKKLQSGESYNLKEEILKNAQDRCEMCYAPNGKRIARFHEDKDIVIPWEVVKRGLYNNTELIKLDIFPLDSEDNKDPDSYMALCSFCIHKLNKYKTKQRKNKNVFKSH